VYKPWKSEDEHKEGEEEEEESEEEEEEEEPKLKYERLGNAVNDILKGKECASCMAVHSKVMKNSVNLVGCYQRSKSSLISLPHKIMSIAPWRKTIIHL
jgi:hypothetical protein